jgi:hypothetical protein
VSWVIIDVGEEVGLGEGGYDVFAGTAVAVAVCSDLKEIEFAT